MGFNYIKLLGTNISEHEGKAIDDYRFTHCLLFLALGFPGFFGSTIRESLVKNFPGFNIGRSSGANFDIACMFIICVLEVKKVFFKSHIYHHHLGFWIG